MFSEFWNSTMTEKTTFSLIWCTDISQKFYISWKKTILLDLQGEMELHFLPQNSLPSWPDTLWDI